MANNKRTKRSRAQNVEPSHVRKGKKLGLKYNRKGNLIIPTTTKQLSKFNQNVLKDPEVFHEVLKQRDGQLNEGGGTIIKGSVPDKVVEMRRNGWSDSLLGDLFEEDDIAGEVTVSKAPRNLFRSTCRKFAATVVGVAYQRGIDLDSNVVIDGSPSINASVGECVYWRILLDIYDLCSGGVSRLGINHRDIYMHLAALSPRVCTRSDGQNYSYYWDNLDDSFDDFFSAADLVPGISEGITIGGVSADTNFNYARFNLVNVPSEEQIIQFCTQPYEQVITQMGKRDGKFSLINPQLWVPERETSAAFSIPTDFGPSNTSLRYWANVRNEIPFATKYLPQACTGWVDSTGDVDDLPVRTIQHVGVGHFGYRFNHTQEYQAGRSIPLLVYPKIVFCETLMWRAAAILVTGDMRVTDTSPDYVAGTINQKDSSVIRGLTNVGTTLYMLNVLLNIFYDNIAGAFMLPTKVIALAGSAYKPNPQYKAAPWPTNLCENTALLGPSHKQVMGEYGEMFTRVTLPTLCVSAGSVSCIQSSSPSWSQFMSSMYPSIGLGSDYKFRNASAALDGLLPLGQPTPGHTSEYLSPTSGAQVQLSFIECSYAWSTLQPSVDISVIEPLHGPLSYNYDCMTKIIQVVPNPTSTSVYSAFRFTEFVTSHAYTHLMNPAYLEVVPLVIASQLGDAPLTIEKNTNDLVAMYNQTRRVANINSTVYNESTYLSAIDIVYAVFCTGSQYDGAQTGLTHIYNKRLVCGEGGFFAILRMVPSGIETVTHIGANIAEHFGEGKLAERLRTVSHVSGTINKFVNPLSSKMALSREIHGKMIEYNAHLLYKVNNNIDHESDLDIDSSTSDHEDEIFNEALQLYRKLIAL